jgi:alpha-1,6-mannosyltransferase
MRLEPKTPTFFRCLRHWAGQRWLLPALALTLAVALCVGLTVLNLGKYHCILAGGQEHENYAATGGASFRAVLNVVYLALVGLYLIWLLRGRNEADDPSILHLLRRAAPFLLLAYATYPLSNDIYVYLQYGFMGLHGVNPYLHATSSFPSSLSRLAVWDQTATYGPVSLVLFMASAVALPLGPVAAVYLFKLFCLMLHVANASFIGTLLGHSRHRSRIVLAYLVNPYLLSEHVADGHVDVFLCFTVVLLAGALLRRCYLTAFVALLLGILVKTLPIIWLPLLLVFLVRRRRWWELAGGLALILGVVVALTLTVLPTLQAWRSLANPGVAGLAARSVHHLFDLGLGRFLGSMPDLARQESLAWLTRSTVALFALVYAATLLRIYRRPGYSAPDLVADLGRSALVLFLVATPWVMPWYATVLVPLVALTLRNRRFALTGLTYALSSALFLGAGAGEGLFHLLISLLTVGPTLAVMLAAGTFPDWTQKCLLSAGQLLGRGRGEADRSGFVPAPPFSMRSPSAPCDKVSSR